MVMFFEDNEFVGKNKIRDFVFEEESMTIPPIHIVACDEASSYLQEQTQDPQELVLHEPISLQRSLQDPNSEKWIETIN